MTARPRSILALCAMALPLSLVSACASHELKLEMERQVVVTPPKIDSLAAQPSGKVDTTDGDQTVHVTLKGDPGLTGTCDAQVGQGAETIRVPLTETQPGTYEGDFPVKQGETGSINLVGHLKHESSGAQQQLSQGGILQLVSNPKPVDQGGGASGDAAAQATPSPCAGPAAKTLDDQLQAFTIHFDFNDATLHSDAMKMLDSAAQALRTAGCRIVVAGHTDQVGSPDYNQALSERRSTAVLNYLVGQGIAADRLESVGYGKSRPVDDSGTPQAAQRNRRVEMHPADAR